MYSTVHGLVLREVEFKEADKMLTVLTQEEGKISVRARGALRKSCRFSAAAQQLVYSEMTLFSNRGRYALEEAAVVEDFSGLRENLETLALAAYFAELLEAVSDEDSPNPDMLRLGLNALYALSRSLFPAKLIKAAFELRAMCISGYEPSIEFCSECGAVNITNGVFDLAGGTLVCANCAQKLALSGEKPDISVLSAMRHITGSELKRVFSFSLNDEKAARELGRICERYALLQLDRGFGALDYYRKLI